jgi:3-oxoacyl-[acyl-carrier protein] reductase
MIPIALDGRVAFVTGASRGIGLATTRRLLDAGATVVANLRLIGEESRHVFAGLSAEHPDRVVIVEGSITDPAVVDVAAKTIFQRFRRLDILVNNAGIQRDSYIGMISEAEIEDTLATNVGGMIRVTQTMARLMRRQKAGSIINLASIMALRGNVAQLVYAASKAAVIGATYSAAKELAPQGIRVNAVAPGLIETQMTANMPDDVRSMLTSRIAMGRAGEAGDVADVIVFLASDLSRYITGQVLGVDGGLVV